MNNNKAKHTPGPWIYTNWGKDGDEANIRAKDGENTLHIGVVSFRNVDANARLIAAAPELLEALESILKTLNAVTEHTPYNGIVETTDSYKNAISAIAKAKGE